MKIRLFLISFLLSLPFWWGINYFQKNLENFFYAQISYPVQEIKIERPKKPNLEIEAKSAISLKINKISREKIVFRKEIDQILPIASLTKLMTVLIIVEDPENYNFSKIIEVSKKAASQEDVPEYGNLKRGEKLSVKKLLDLMLIYSSNDAAWALAEVIGVENFVEKMNQKANALDLLSTQFVNPTGLDPKNLHWSKETKSYFNYSTANDLAKLGKYILEEFPLIFEISNKRNKLNLSLNQKIIGIKTGYTDEAGGCVFLIFSNEKENYFINVILGTEGVEARFEEMQKLIDWLNL